MNYSCVKFQKVDVFNNRIYFTKSTKPCQSETRLNNHQSDFFDKIALAVGRHFPPKDANLIITLNLMKVVKNKNKPTKILSMFKHKHFWNKTVETLHSYSINKDITLVLYQPSYAPLFTKFLRVYVVYGLWRV